MRYSCGESSYPTRRPLSWSSPTLQISSLGASCRSSQGSRDGERSTFKVQGWYSTVQYSSYIILPYVSETDQALPLPRRESTLPPTAFIFCASPTSSPMSLLYVSESCCSASLVWSKWVNRVDVFCVCVRNSDK